MNRTIVFISYAREDAEAARRVYRTLKGAGLTPWMDEFDLLPGEQWKIAIQKAIRNNRFFLALISRRSVARKGYAHNELSRALEELDSFPDSDIYLIPARLDECEMPRHRMRELHWVDLFPDWDSGVSKIMKTIGKNYYWPDPEFNESLLSPLRLRAPYEMVKDIMDFRDPPPYGHLADSKSDTMLAPDLAPAIGVDVVSILDNVPLEPSSTDPNKENWATHMATVIDDSIEGFWSSRWFSADSPKGRWHSGTALVRTVGDWVIIEVQDDTNQYIIRARTDSPSRLVGRYMNCTNPLDTTPWVGILVDGTRIDGFWNTGRDRWDFRRGTFPSHETCPRDTAMLSS